MEGDRIRSALQTLVNGLERGLDYRAFYRARVVSQSGQTLELQPLDERIPALKDVPIWHGIPGVSTEVEKDAVVLLGFLDGNPAEPFAHLWDSESLKKVEIVCKGDVSVTSDGSVSVECRGKASVKSDSSVSVEAKATASVKADGEVSVDGGIVRIGGTAAVLGLARQTDPVQAGPFAGTITKGSVKVFGA